MVHFLQRFQNQIVKLALYMAAFTSMLFDHLVPGSEQFELITADAQPSPQQMLVRLTTIMIAGSLSMLAWGYSVRARVVPVRDRLFKTSPR